MQGNTEEKFLKHARATVSDLGLKECAGNLGLMASNSNSINDAFKKIAEWGGPLLGSVEWNLKAEA